MSIQWEPIIIFPSIVLEGLNLRTTIEIMKGEAEEIKRLLSTSEVDLSINGIRSTDFCDGVIKVCDYLLSVLEVREDVITH